MRSSYESNHYDNLLFSIAEIHKPKFIVELGVLDGYSLRALASGCFPKTQVYAFDLFEEYEYKHGNRDEVNEYLLKNNLNVALVKLDAILAAELFEDNSIGVLHVDISNDGDKLAKVFDAWTEKIQHDGIIVFEGGSQERDNIEWMKKYDKTPICEFKKTLTERGFEFVTLAPFPSMTICRKVL